MKNNARKKYLKMLLKISLGISVALTILYFLFAGFLIYIEKNQIKNLIEKQGIKSIPQIAISSLSSPLFLGYAFFLRPKIMEMKIRNSFQSIPGVTVKSLSIYDENHFANVEINIKNKGNIVFTGFFRETFSNAEYLTISSIGQCQLHSLNRKDAINVGGKGDFSRLFGLRIITVKDVINNYDYILNIVKKLPNSEQTSTDKVPFTAQCPE